MATPGFSEHFYLKTAKVSKNNKYLMSSDAPVFNFLAVGFNRRMAFT